MLERDINGIGVVNDDSSWLDDGQPLDSTTREISFAFEHVLGRTILSALLLSILWDVQFYQTYINASEHSSFPMELLLVNILLKYIVNISNILFNLYSNIMFSLYSVILHILYSNIYYFYLILIKNSLYYNII